MLDFEITVMFDELSIPIKCYSHLIKTSYMKKITNNTRNVFIITPYSINPKMKECMEYIFHNEDIVSKYVIKKLTGNISIYRLSSKGRQFFHRIETDDILYLLSMMHLLEIEPYVSAFIFFLSSRDLTKEEIIGYVYRNEMTQKKIYYSD